MCGCIIACAKIIVNKKRENVNSFYHAVFYAIDKPQQLI